MWTYGCQLADSNPRLDKKTQVETKKMTGYGTRFRCAEIVDTIFLKGHVVDPAQARTYKLVSNILNLLLMAPTRTALFGSGVWLVLEAGAQSPKRRKR